VKGYENQLTSASIVTRYAIMNVTEACACAAMLFGKVSRHVSDHRLILLVILFNTVAVGMRGLVSLLADRAVRSRHSGVRLGVLLFTLGFLWPVELGITLKVVLAAVGSAVYHAFSTSTVQAKSAFRASGMGFLSAGAALGTALGRYATFYGYLSIILFMILACPTDKCCDLPEAKENRLKRAPKTPFSPLFVPLLAIAAGALSYAVSSLDLPWDVNRRTMLLIALAITLGRGLGGVVTDLLGNAVKFTPSKKKISVSLYREGRSVVVKIADEGIGIPKEAQSHIFEKFYQADKMRSSGGTGLGLALVSRIVTLCEGSVSVESEEGKGSAFTVKLPE